MEEFVIYIISPNVFEICFFKGNRIHATIKKKTLIYTIERRCFLHYAFSEYCQEHGRILEYYTQF